MTLTRTVQVGGAAFFAGFVTALLAAIVVSRGRKNSLKGSDGVSGELEDMLGI
jgi:hypothetical protein